MTEIARVREGSAPWSVGIVGAGIIGLATAKALQHRGVEFEIFEHGAPGGGESRGPSRLFHRQGEDPRITELMSTSIGLWQQWQRDLEVGLISLRGVVSFGGLHPGHSGGLPEARRLADQDLKSVLPILDGASGPATIDPQSGVIWSRVAIGSLLGQVGQYLIPARVDRLEFLPDGRIQIGAGEIERTHDAVVVAAGGSTAAIAETVGVEIPVVRRAKVMTVHRVKPFAADDQLPGFRDFARRNEVGNGMPDRDDELYAVGLNRDLETDGNGGFDPEAVEQLARTTQTWVSEVIPGLATEPKAVTADWATGVPWGVDGIGIWRQGPILFPAGMKMFGLAPVIGEVLADAAEGKPVRREFRPESRLGEAPRWAGSALSELTG